jgi:hypothetical protein
MKPRRTRRKTSKERSQESEHLFWISDFGLKNKQKIGGKEQNPKSAFSNPKCEGSIAPFSHYSMTP